MIFLQRFRIVFHIIICFTIVSLILGCKEDNIAPSPTMPEVSGINDNLLGLNKIDQIPEKPKSPLGDPQTDTTKVGDTTTICTVQQYEQAAGYKEQIALNPLTDVIWPGSIINGATIMTGEYTPITASRGPLTFSISNQFFASPSRTVQSPTLSSVRGAIAEILNQQVSGTNPAQLSFEIVSIHSEEQLKLSIGATYDDGLFRINGQFDFENTNKYTKILVKFIQVFYTLDIDIPTKPADLFASTVTWDDLRSQISQNISPTVVSTIAYGRMGLFSVESSSSFTEVSAMLEATYGDPASFNASGEYNSILEQTTTKGTIIGGSGGTAVSTITGYDAFIEHIVAGGNWSPDNPGAPLAYKLRYLNDFSIANVVLYANYNIRNCQNLIYDPGPEGHFKIEHSGSFSARAGYSYWLDGVWSGDIFRQFYYGVPSHTFDITVPAGAYTIYCWVDLDRGVSEFSRIYVEGSPFSENVNKCYLLSGAVWSEHLDQTDCSAP